MKRNWLSGLIILWLSLSVSGCGRATGDQDSAASKGNDKEQKGAVLKTKSLEIDFSKHKAAFLELGSDRCIPCRQMQPIMREIAAAFPEDVLVVFYDVWEDPAPARKYKIQLIPTQIFIDREGKEFFRHVGLYPKEEILKVLEKMGVRK
jgi:thioredoxin 1